MHFRKLLCKDVLFLRFSLRRLQHSKQLIFIWFLNCFLQLKSTLNHNINMSRSVSFTINDLSLVPLHPLTLVAKLCQLRVVHLRKSRNIKQESTLLLLSFFKNFISDSIELVRVNFHCVYFIFVLGRDCYQTFEIIAVYK